MAKTPEAKVKDKIKDIIKEVGGYFALPVMQGMAQNGTPDILACINGVFFGIEAKAGRGKPSDLQRVRLREIYQAGGLAMVVNEKNLEAFRAVALAAASSRDELVLAWQTDGAVLFHDWNILRGSDGHS